MFIILTAIVAAILTGAWIFARLPAKKRVTLGRSWTAVIRLPAQALRRARLRAAKDTKRSGTLSERNQDIIVNRLNAISANSDSYHIEQQFTDCAWEIAMREGRPWLASHLRAPLSEWDYRSGISQEYRELKSYLLPLFRARQSQLMKEDLQRKENERIRLEEVKRQQVETERETLIERNLDLIDKFLEITERKVSILDDYGDENWGVLPNEIIICLRKIAERQGLQFNWEQYARGKHEANLVHESFSYRHRARQLHLTLLGPRELANDPGKNRRTVEDFVWLEGVLEEDFRRHHDEAKSTPPKEIQNSRLSGEEFETHVARLLRLRGYEVAGTPRVGDQGADLVAKKDGKTIIVQVKRYQGPVGNKAVQEVIGAVCFYGGNEGWVVTNSTFTSAAKALAQKNGVTLIDGIDLERWARQ